MRMSKLFLTGICALALGIGSAAAQDTKYQQWPGYEATPEVEELIEQLELLIAQAEKDKAADPQFLADLRDALASFQNPWNVRLLLDDFNDGEYARNPAWAVSAGQFRVDRGKGLRSTIIPPGYVSGQAAPTTGSPALDILSTILTAPGQTAATTAQYAAISTPVKISNAFAVRFELASAERFGRLSFGPYQGPTGNVGYRVAYQPNARESLLLLRVTSKGTVPIGAYRGALNLEDGRRHVIEWTRDRDGLMTVYLDGQDLLEATDKSIAKPFDGFLMINSGGTYWVRSVAVDGRK